MLGLVCLSGCQGNAVGPDPAPIGSDTVPHHASTQAIDAYDAQLRNDALLDTDRSQLYAQRWPAVQRAVAHAGVMHDGAFYAARAYWHTGYLRERDLAFEQAGDLNAMTLVDGRGAVRITGDVNAPLEMTGEATVFIFGDLNAPLTLRGNCEVIVAGAIGEEGAVACDGTLHLFVGGPMHGLVGCTGGSVVVIDDDLTGLVRCGEPATRITVTGDLTGRVVPPGEAESVLAMRVDGYAPNRAVLEIMAGGFTRVNATLGSSDTPPGLYPDPAASNRPPTSRWVVLRQAGDARQ